MASLYRNLLLHKAGPAQLIQWFYSQQEFDICGSKLPIGLTNPLINKGYMPGDNGARPWSTTHLHLAAWWKKDSLPPSHCRAVLQTPTPQHVKLTLLHVHSETIIIVNETHGRLLLFALNRTKINQLVLSVNIFRHPHNEQFYTWQFEKQELCTEKPQLFDLFMNNNQWLKTWIILLSLLEDCHGLRLETGLRWCAITKLCIWTFKLNLQVNNNGGGVK